VQETVREEHRHLGQHGPAARACLLSRGGHAHDDIAQEIAREPRKIPFAHRECEDVGGAVLSAVRFVQLLDLNVVR
jgi:hypothetical protein